MKTNFVVRLRRFLLSDRFTSLHAIIQIITMIGWLALLIKTSAYFVVYMLVCIGGLFCRNLVNKDKRDFFYRAERLNVIIAAVFSLVIIAANYDIYSSVVKAIASHSEAASGFLLSHISVASFGIFLLYFPVLFFGGMYNAFFILKYITQRLTPFFWKPHQYSAEPHRVFLSALILLSVFYSAVMLLCFYPGIITPDSVKQLNEIINNHYSNRNPVFHTLFIRIFIRIGLDVFNSVSFGAALYSLFSVVFLSSAFAYAVVTLYQLKISKKLLIAVTLSYMLMPYHILYSFTMWKDVPFSASVLMFTVSLFRWFKRIGKNEWLNAVIMILSSFGICLFRGNGMIAYFVFILVFAVLFGKKYRKISLSYASILAVALLLSYPVLSLLNVEQSDSVELLTIPIQQISRSIIDDGDLTESQRELLSNVVDIDAIPETYNPLISDPIKTLYRETNNEKFYKTHKRQFVKLYLEIGLSHPKSYFTAWVDQTKGYWNAGYDHWRFSYAGLGEELGVKKHVVSNGLQKAVYAYSELFEYVEIFQPFVSIGLFTWLTLLAAFVGYRKKDKISMIATVPSLAIVFSMLLGSPVFSEFRYVYAMFCCIPFLAIAVFCREKAGEKTEILSNNNED